MEDLIRTMMDLIAGEACDQKIDKSKYEDRSIKAYTKRAIPVNEFSVGSPHGMQVHFIAGNPCCQPGYDPLSVNNPGEKR